MVSISGQGKNGAISALGQSKKGQIFSTELILSVSIFLAALLIFLFVWNSIFTYYTEEQSERKMQVALIGISDMAVFSPGDPQDWEETSGIDANSFGFVSSRNVLSEKKLFAAQRIFASNYSEIKARMGAGGYGLYFEVRDAQNGLTYYNFGNDADAANSSVSQSTSERLALLGDKLVVMKIQLWRVKGRSI